MGKIITLGILLVFGLLAGCSHSIIAKECKPVEGDPKFVCRSILPWN